MSDLLVADKDVFVQNLLNRLSITSDHENFDSLKVGDERNLWEKMMKVEFLLDCEIEVIESFDEAMDDAESTTELFHKGDQTEFDILDHPQRFNGDEFEDHPTMVNVQFGDGSVAFGLSCEWYKEIE